MEVTKKLGRPKGITKNIQTRIRLSEEEAEKLEFCSKTMNLSKTEIIRIGIDKVYKEIKK